MVIKLYLERPNDWKSVFRNRSYVDIDMRPYFETSVYSPKEVEEFIQHLQKYTRYFHFNLTSYCLEDEFHRFIDYKLDYATYYTQIEVGETIDEENDDVVSYVRSYEVVEIWTIDAFKQLQQKFPDVVFEVARIQFHSNNIRMINRTTRTIEWFRMLNDVKLADLDFITIDKQIMLNNDNINW